MDTAVVPCAWGAPGLGLEVDRPPLTSVIASDLDHVGAKKSLKKYLVDSHLRNSLKCLQND